MMHVFNFIGVFYILLFVGCITLFFLTRDDWYKMLFFSASIFMFLLLLYFAHFQGAVDNAMPLNKKNIVLDGIDLDNLDIVSQEVINSDDYVIQPFDNIESREEIGYMDTNLCFFYNNSDAGENAVKIVEGTNVISNLIYLDNNTFGWKCVHINSSYVKEEFNLGLFCEDCTGINPLNLPEFNGTLINEIHITKGAPLTYDINQELPHGFYIEVLLLPKRQAIESLNIFNWGLALFVLLFGSRYLWKLFYDSEDGDGWNAF